MRTLTLVAFAWWFAVHHTTNYADSFTVIGPFADETKCNEVASWARAEGASTSKCWES
jgi:hypothetical protein